MEAKGTAPACSYQLKWFAVQKNRIKGFGQRKGEQVIIGSNNKDHLYAKKSPVSRGRRFGYVTHHLFNVIL